MAQNVYGKFTQTIAPNEISRGLRPSDHSPRNRTYLFESKGAVGKDDVLQALDSITRLDTSVITDAFPFPQIFVFTNMIIVCGLYKIYELESGALTLKYTATTPGGTWSAVDFYDYIYLSNGVEAVIRDAGSKEYAITTDVPTATTICNYNGQVLIGSPGVAGLSADFVLPASSFTTTTEIIGTIATT